MSAPVPQFLHRWRRAATVGALFVALLAAIVWRGDWPEIYAFAAPSGSTGIARWLDTPVHLSDDMMITLRSGDMLGELGRPAYNRSDNAQPSTSYLAPYVFWGLRQLASGYGAVYLYALLGAAAVAGTLLLIGLCAGRFWAGAGVVLLLGATGTLAEFSLTGWDHLFQGLLLVAAAVVALAPGGASGAGVIAVAALGALGVLYRPDGLLIAAALLLAVRARRTGWRARAGATALFAALIGGALLVNWVQFGHLTPTTARLKIGASPSLAYSLNYVVKNAFQRFSALTVFLGLVIFHLLRLRRLDRRARWVFWATVATGAAAAFNSDVFAQARMFWTPACVLAVLAVAARQPVRARWLQGATAAPAVLAGAGAVSIVALALAFSPPRLHVIDRQGAPASFTAPQYLLTQWINRNLSPQDGPIGLYWLGMAYYLPRFDVADFLGKADEMVANSPQKWGPPGHNKWQTEATVAKWHPQIIIATLPPPQNRDFAQYVSQSRDRFRRRESWGFVADLVLSPRVAQGYKYCYVSGDIWGFYARNDIAARHATEMTCYAPFSETPNQPLGPR